MKYRKGFKYQLAEDEIFKTSIYPGEDIVERFIYLGKNGMLVVRAGYAWDGPSGPTVDRKTNMRGSLCHDALYQLIRQRLLPESWRKKCDDEIYKCLLQDGMWEWWAKRWKNSLKKFAGFAADPKNIKKVYEAPAKKHIQPKRKLNI